METLINLSINRLFITITVDGAYRSKYFPSVFVSPELNKVGHAQKHNFQKENVFTCSRLWANPDAGEVTLEQVADEGGLASGVLAHQQDHGLGIEVGIL